MRPYNAFQQIECIDRRRTAYIMWRDIPIATISHEYASISGEEDWAIAPLYDNIEKCLRLYGEYIAIAGIDLDMRKPVYYRQFLCGFVDQRTIPDGRGDLPAELKRLKMRTNDLFEVMCRGHALTGNDDFYVSRTPDKVIDVRQRIIPLDIPDDIDAYENEGWLVGN